MVLKKAEETNFIIWCSAECALLVLDAAQRVGLLDARHSYVVLAPELHTMPLHDYSHGGANITGERTPPVATRHPLPPRESTQ